MSLTKAMSIGRSGLIAAAHGTNVTAQNIANAATQGYSRRGVNLQSVQMDHGGGVKVSATSRVQDALLEKRALGARAGSGEAEGRVGTLNILDAVLADDPGDLGWAIDAFETAIADFATQPSEPGTRQALLASAQQLSQAFNRTAEGLSDARVAANERIVDTIGQVNRQLAEIGALTRDIIIAKNSPNGDAGDLMDQRDRLVREVGTALPITAMQDDKGNFSLRLNGGLSLVDVEGGVHPLQTNLEPGTGDVHVYRDISGRTEDITKQITGGLIGGTMTARDGALGNAQAALDRLAFDMAEAYNTVHRAGVGLDGGTGRNLFSVSVSSGVAGAASTMSLSSDVAGQPDHLAAAESAASLPSDNRNALRLLDVRDQKLTNGGVDTAQSAFTSIVAGAGSALRAAMDRQVQTDSTVAQMDALRESVSGVSSDDEMISLMRYQRAYQASLRVVETADQMMQELLRLGR
jgi:flagellar hook-associated protein 1